MSVGSAVPAYDERRLCPLARDDADPTARFSELVNGPEADLPLDEAAFWLGAHAQPDLDVAAQLGRLDALAADCRGPLVEDVITALFTRYGLRGDRRRYADPRNSYLHEVLDRRVGIPISLAVVTIEVARRIGLQLEGVGMPGYFLVGGRHGGFIDVFGGGSLIEASGCRDIHQRVFGPAAHWSDDFLAPTGRRDILTRMLANLTRSFRSLEDRAGREWVVRLRATIPDRSAGEDLDLAGELEDLGHFDRSAQRLEDLAERAGADTEAAERLQSRALRLRARLN